MEKKIIINAKGTKELKEAIRLVAFTKRMSSSAYIVHVLENTPEVAAQMKHAPQPAKATAAAPKPAPAKKAAPVQKKSAPGLNS